MTTDFFLSKLFIIYALALRTCAAPMCTVIPHSMNRPHQPAVRFEPNRAERATTTCHDKPNVCRTCALAVSSVYINIIEHSFHRYVT